MTLSPNLGRLDTGSSKDVSSADERPEDVNAVISGGHFFSDAVSVSREYVFFKLKDMPV